MTRRRRRRFDERPGPAGFVVVDKPRGWTSHGVVDAARSWLGTQRVGHLGTLDPLATGVLPLAVREATKLAPFLEAGDKTYVGQIRLGEETDTLDGEGRIVRRHQGALPGEAEVRGALARFRGAIEQVPPMFSAVKRRGVPLHRLARQGREVERRPKCVRIERLELRAYAPPVLDIEVTCSAGTYVRSLASDLGARLGCGAHVSALRRTRSGPFELSMAGSPEELACEAQAGEVAQCVIPAVNLLGYPVVRLDPRQTRRVMHGGEIPAPGRTLSAGAKVAALDPSGELVAVLEMRGARRLHPVRVLRSLAPLG